MKVAVKTYAEYSEVEYLHPGFEIHPKSADPWKLPLWLVLSNGKVLAEESGFLSNEEVLAFLKNTVSHERHNHSSRIER